ncbi:MAG TPA: DUF4214 domain-containing protein [Pirellulales bacterium]|nr:DUF4214 domain-containing protein [Pirellulales bacterium]
MKRRRRNYPAKLESLERRELLSVSPTGTTFAPTEGAVFAGTVATFTATDAGPFTASIKWGDGTTTTGIITGGPTFTVSGTKTYADEGTNAVSVVISDAADSTTATATSTATVAEADTLASPAGATVSATEGTTFSGAVATFTNTGFATNPPSDFTANIVWGDGTTTAGVVSGALGTLTVSGSHLYADEGSNPLTVTLADNAPGTAAATATGTATVAEGDALTPGTATVSATEGTTFSGTVATFTNTGFAANPAADFTASIVWGDGTTSAGTVSGSSGTLTVSGSHLYADEGANPLTVTLADNAPGTATATAVGSATVAERDALTAGPATVSATEGTTFSGTVATFTNTGFAANPAADFAATIVWGDGTTNTGTISGSSGTLTVSGSHLYADEGSNPLTDTLTDDAPGTATATATGTATVAEADTLASPAGATVSATEGATFSGTVATFTNTGFAANPAADFAATIVWGDGTTTAGVVSGSLGTLTVSGSHAYADEGSNPLTVTLADNAPGTATATATGTATVAEADTLVAGTLATVTVTEGATFAGTVATFINATNLPNPASDFTATINWGDGTTGTGVVSGGAGAVLTVSGSHTYADEGSFTITVALADDAPGTASATTSTTATVTEADTLVAGAAATLTPTEGATFTGTLATFTNTTNPTNPASDFTATINWGDGSTGVGTVSGSAGAFTVTGSHLYAEEGTNTATVILADNAPGTATATATASVAVADATLNATGTAVAGSAGVAFAGTVASFTDANPGGTVSDFSATIAWGDGTTTAGTVAANGSAGFKVSGTHTYASAGTDTITVHVADVGGSTANATSTATVSSGSAQVSIAKSAPSTGTVGTNLSYTVTVTNGAGAASAAAVTMTDTLPAGVSFVAATDTSGGTITNTGSTVTDVIGTLAAGATDTITIVVTPGSSTAGTTITNSASVTTTTPNTGTPTTASASTSIAPVTAAPTLTISKSASATGTVGQNLTYIVAIGNTGTGAATGTTFTDPLPAGLTFVSATDSLGGTVTNTGGTLSENIGSLAAGATDTITIVVTPGSSLAGQSVTNTASASATNFNGGASISSSATTSISGTVVTTGVGFLAGVPGDATEPTFVHNLYRELLGREPDSAGNASWVAFLQQHDNAVGRTQVIAGFLDSPEYAIHYITTVYEVILGRAPDAPGLQFWTQKMGPPASPGTTGSADEKGIVAAFFGSDEFYIRSGNTPQGWINALYQDILNRAPDGSGAAFWAHELSVRGSGDRDGIVRDLLTTPEAAHFILDTFYPTAGGTASTPLAPPGSFAGTGRDELSLLTGAGWENLYLEGPYGNNPQGNDAFFTALAGGAGWDDLQVLILNTAQYYTNPNRPVTSGLPA